MKGRLHGLAICAGIGGIDLGLKRTYPGYRTVCHIEREAYAAAVLVKQMEEGRLDQAPIWSDLGSFHGRQWRGVVDIITAGLPCQPYSVAGRQKGDADERYIWPEFFRIVREVRPSLVFLENVPGLLAWFRPIGEELSGMGYEFEAGLFSAAEVGASHKRQRLFILAHSTERNGKERKPWSSNQQGSEGGVPGEPRGGHRFMGNPHQQGPQGRGLQGGERGGEWPTWPPGPSDTEGWASILQRYPELAPAVADSGGMGPQNANGEAGATSHRGSFSGKGMADSLRVRKQRRGDGGISDGDDPKRKEVESAIRGVAHGLANRVDRLRSCGNAVVPATVARAFNALSRC